MASNRDWGVDAQSLTLPPFAGPNDPAIVVGPDIPPEIVAFYAPDTVISVLIFRQSQGNYICFALVDPLLGRSFVDVVGRESVGALVSIANRWRMGTIGIDTSMAVLSNDYTYDGTDLPRVVAGYGIATANSAGIVSPASAVVISTAATVTIVSGRAYRFSYASSHFSAAVGALAQYAFTRAGGGGFSLGGGNWRTEGGASTGLAFSKVAVRAPAIVNIVDTFQVTLTALSSTITAFGSAGVPRELLVQDIGASTDFPSATLIT